MKTKNKILVVDDKGINRYMLGNIFREEYEIVEASGGQMAIDVMETEAGSLAVVIVTDDDSEETSDRAYEYKVADIVIKPFEPKIIRRRVQNIIDLYTYREKYGKKI